MTVPYLGSDVIMARIRRKRPINIITDMTLPQMANLSTSILVIVPLMLYCRTKILIFPLKSAVTAKKCTTIPKSVTHAFFFFFFFLVVKPITF